MLGAISKTPSSVAVAVKLRKPIIGYRQPILEICGQSEQGKTGIALTAASMNPDMAGEPGCPTNFPKLFENLGKDPSSPICRIVPIERVNIVDGEQDTDRLITVLNTFPEKMVSRINVMETSADDGSRDVESAIDAFERFNQDRAIQGNKANCNIYDTITGFVADLNRQQRVVSKKHAEEEVKRKRAAGNPTAATPAILDDELGKFAQYEWEWRNEKVGTLLRNVKSSPCMTILTTKNKKQYVGPNWDGKSYEPHSPAEAWYMEDIRLNLIRSSREVSVEVIKNRFSTNTSGKRKTFKLTIWTLAEILLWLYNIE